MSGRGRGRGRGGAGTDTGAGRARRSTRQAAVQQQEQSEPTPSINTQSPAQQSIQAIPSQDGLMGPPPPPGIKNVQGPSVYQFSRRGAPRSERGGSLASLNSIAVSDSVYTAMTSQADHLSAALGTPVRPINVPVRATSVPFSVKYETPGKRARQTVFMTRRLRDLKNTSVEFFEHLCTDQDNEGWEEAHEQIRFIYDAFRRVYVGKNSEPTIDPSFVLEAMGHHEGTPAWYEAYRTVYLANLAALLQDIQTTEQQDYLPLLQSWEDDFPKFYIPKDQDIAGVSEMVIDIRTQLSIFTLKKFRQDGSIDFHPYEMIAKIWSGEDISASKVEAALGGNQDELQLKPVDPEDPDSALHSERAWTRLRSLCEHFLNQHLTPGTEDAFDQALNQLQSTYDFSEFVKHLRALVEDSFLRTKEALDAAELPLPGQSSDASRIDSQIQTQLEAEMAQDPASSYNVGYPSSLPTYPRIPYPEFSQESSPGFSDQAPRSGFQNGAIYAQSAAQVTTTTGGRKKRGAAAADASGDQENTQPKKRARRKKNADAESDPSANGQVVPVQPAAPIQYPPLPGTQLEPDFDALTQRSKEISAANRKAREPQVRSAWVRNDVRELVKAVHTYGCKWSVIEKQIKEGNIHFERPRDQQALRDKARLLKQDFLKVDGVLPKGFDLVVLGKKEREAVKACGKNPDRKESDLDANGHPINTEFGDSVTAAAHAAPVAQMDALPPPPPHDPQLLQGAVHGVQGNDIGMDGGQDGIQDNGFSEHGKSEADPVHDPAMDASAEAQPVISDLQPLTTV
ncbi:uncharacterized protein QC761_120310 [Podospora bellae-mahoneyi]|uniref:Myb-like domain-containing protein n=1 Tax=Podospora bellae-mahoneyi TaxID=2093777 RepID=A0ABR0G1I0_9PEZI|nr:hypothetical protein QC761_120310 [Podospora bellae-mahoneyi]